MNRFYASESQTDPVFARIVEEVTHKLQSGKPIDVDIYAERFPDQIEQLKDLLPTLEALAAAGPEANISTGIDDAAISEIGTVRTLGDFHLLDEIGRGGMGVVYEAQQISLDRRVALKILPFAAILDKRQLQRFKNEAQAAAGLRHPNIVAVHAIGCERGVHFYAMDRIEGETLAEVISQLQANSSETNDTALKNETPVSLSFAGTEPSATLSTELSSHGQSYFRSIARIAIQAADALEYAHGHGIVHRDVKPSNLMLDGSGNLWVTDFGLAMTQADSGLTMTGDLLGTLRYMSPEQASGRRVVLDHRTDIYSLGATLYELATLQPAFDHLERNELLRRVVEEEPQSPRQIKNSIPRDLETIVLKAMRKNPEDRYATAEEMAADLRRFLKDEPILAASPESVHPSEMAADLRRFLKDEPILAKPPTVIEYAAKWSRRHWGILWVGVAALAVLAVVSSVSALLLSQSNREVQLQREVAQQEALTSRQLLYAADVRLAYDAWQVARHVARVRELLSRHIPRDGQEDLREFAWHYLWNLSQGGRKTIAAHDADVFCLAYSPDQRVLATASKDGTAKLWDTATWEVKYVLAGHTSELTSVAFSPTGDLVATGSEDDTVRLWNPADGQEIATLRSHTDDVLAIAFSPDGHLLASGGRDFSVRIWDTRTRMLRTSLTGAMNDIRALAFSPDGTMLVAGDADGTIHRWETAEWKSLAKVDRSEISEPDQEEKIFAVDFSPDSKWLAAAGRRRIVHLWRINKGSLRLKSSRNGHQDWVQSVAFSPDSSVIASGGKDSVINLWSVNPPTQTPKVLLGHTARVWSVKWSHDGQQLVSGSADGSVKVWDVSVAAYRPTREVLSPSPFCTAAYASDGNAIITGDFEGNVKTWDPASFTCNGSFALHQSPVLSVAVSPDGTLGASCSNDGVTNLWDVATGDVLFVWTTSPRDTAMPAFSPDGKKLALVDDGSTVVLLEIATHQVINRLSHQQVVHNVAFFPSGRILASNSGKVRLWDVASGQLLDTMTAGGRMAYSQDGRLIAIASYLRIELFDTESGRSRGVLTGQTDATLSMAFSPDDLTLATGSVSGEVKLWDVRTAQELATFTIPGCHTRSLSFSSDGSRLVAAAEAADKGHLIEWSTRTWSE